MPKSSDNLAALELVGAVAFDLATLERHEDRNLESENLIQKISSAQQHVDGGLGEVLAATENLLHCMQQELVPDVGGSFQTLLDVAQFLHDATTTDAIHEEDNTIVDELLERIDFLASGGIESELPRGESSALGLSTEFRKLNFPIENPENVEDPLLASFSEQIASTGQLLVSRVGHNKSTPVARALAQHNRILDSLTRQIQEQSHIKLSSLFSSLRTTVFENQELGGVESRVRFRGPPQGQYIYKSTANLFTPILERLLLAFRQLLASNIDASLAVDVQRDDDELRVFFNFDDLKPRYTKRLDSTLAAIMAAGPNNREHDIAEGYREAEAEAVGRELASLLTATRRVGGLLKAKPNNASSMSIHLRIPSDIRLFAALQVRIDSNLYAVEANLVQGLVPASVAHCDFSRNKVTHEDISYEYVTLGVGKSIHDIDSDDRGMLVLLRTDVRRLAFRADEVYDIVQTVRQPTSSGVAFGNLCTSDSEAILLLDFCSPGDLDWENVAGFAKSHTPKHRIYLCDTSEVTAAKLMEAVSGLDIDCKLLHGVAKTIATIQEQRPTLLVFDMHDECSDSLQLFSKIERNVEISPEECLVLIQDTTSNALQENAKIASLPQASRDASTNELRGLLRTKLGL